jgi:hypothetical protein
MVRHSEGRVNPVYRRFTTAPLACVPRVEHTYRVHVHGSDLTGETSAFADWDLVRAQRRESSASVMHIGRRHADHRYQRPTIQAHTTRCNRACLSICVLMAGSMRHLTDIVGVAPRHNGAPHGRFSGGSRGGGATPDDILSTTRTDGSSGRHFPHRGKVSPFLFLPTKSFSRAHAAND